MLRYYIKSETFSYLYLYHLTGKEIPKRALSNITQLTIGASLALLFFHKSYPFLATPFCWYETSSARSVSTPCITSNTFYCSSIMFSGSSVTFDHVKFGGFILKNSRISDVFVGHHLTQHAYSILELNISDLSLGLHFWCIGTPWSYGSTFLLERWPRKDLRGGMILDIRTNMT